jgi:hypothetical protein
MKLLLVALTAITSLGVAATAANANTRYRDKKLNSRGKLLRPVAVTLKMASYQPKASQHNY